MEGLPPKRSSPGGQSITKGEAVAAVTADQVEARVVETLASFGPDADQISRQSTFEELDIDSLDLVELAQVVEDEYGVVLKGEDMKDLKTVGDSIDLIVSRAE
jgi:acyl carrier protein